MRFPRSLFSFRRARASGFTLLELILVLSVGSMITLLSFQGMKRQTESSQAQIVGQQLRTVGQATNTYIANRYSQISQLTNAAGSPTDPGPRTCAGATCTITVQTLVNEGLLPATYQNLNSFGSGYSIALNVSGTSPNWNVVGVVTTAPWASGGVVRYDLLGQAMTAAGADSGMSRTSAAQIDGYGGVWSAPVTGGQLGELGFRVGTGTALYSVYLRRDGTLPMTGDLNLSDGTSHNIYNAANVTGNGRFTSNQDYTNYVNLAGNLDMTGTATVNGAVNVNGNTSVSGTVYTNNFQDYGNATINGNSSVGGSATVAGNSSIGGAETVATNVTVGNHLATNGLSPVDFPAGYAGGVRTWDIYAGGTIGVGTGTTGAVSPSFAIAMNNAGNLVANGSVSAAGNVSGNYLVPNGPASFGSGCAQNGMVGTDGTQTMFCKNGIWSPAATRLTVPTSYVDSPPNSPNCAAGQGGGPLGGVVTPGWVMACGSRACLSLNYTNGGFAEEWNTTSVTLTCF